MKTAIVTTSFLEPQERFDKTIKFINHYKKHTKWDIIVLDNCSPKELLEKFHTEGNVITISFDKHLPRDSHLSYPYLWRAVYYLKTLLKGYDRLIYCDNDFFMLSDKMFKYVEDIKEGWVTFFCPRHQFPETGCHIITKDCPEYENFVADGKFMKYNGFTMETTLPVTKVEKDMIGDRFGEFENKPDFRTVDFWAQATLEDKFD